METPDGIFCCAHCARKDTNADVNDRYPVPAEADASQRNIVAMIPAR